MSASTRDSFDEAYYARFYGSRRTRVHGAAEVGHLARGVTEMIAWLGGEVRSVLDVGAGIGLWRDWFRAHKRGVRYRSIEVSEYACRAYGHERRDIARWKDARDKFDLVVCQGVLPYLSDADAAAAIDNIAAMSKGFLFLEAITERDLDDVCDRDKTDVAVHARPGRWYRERLGKKFRALGCGLWCVKNSSLVFYELEQND